jgi:DNA polymerase I-like protein with 3'-5' exonuclease and polymerase domains
VSLYAVDFETKGLYGEVLGFSIVGDDFETSLPWNAVNRGLLELYLEGSSLVVAVQPGEPWLVFHNAKYDVRIARQNGLRVAKGSYHDTQVLSYVLDASQVTHGLDACCQREGIPGKYDRDNIQWEVWDDEMQVYCLQDGRATRQLADIYLERLRQDARAWDLYTHVELPYVEVLMEMETTGFFINVPKAEKLYRILGRRSEAMLAWMQQQVGVIPGNEMVYKRRLQLNGVMQKVLVQELMPIDTDLPATFGSVPYEIVKSNVKTVRVEYPTWVFVDDGEEYETTGIAATDKYDHCEVKLFNPNSNRHIIHHMNKLGWEPSKFTKTGMESTSAEALEEYDYYPFVKVYLKHAEITKIKDTFLNAFLTGADEYGMLHGEFKGTTTLTGRLSSANPNLQNIPTRGSFGKQMRGLIIAPEGWVIVGIDLSNIEARMLAHLVAKYCSDTRMAEAFAAGVDFHQTNADAWGVSRSDAKTLLFGSLYGAGAKKLGGGDWKKGKAMIDRLNQNAPALQRLKEMVWKSCAKHGMVHSQFGRRLVYPTIDINYSRKVAKTLVAMGKLSPGDVEDMAKGLVAKAQRQVFNAVLQGSSADVLKILTLQVMDYAHELGAFLAAAVHDELLFYVKVDKSEELATYLSKEFKSPLLSHCPIGGDAKIGTSWLSVH